ncbi:MAG TPA: glucuronate isomerase [Verrucomicrobiota bacterium]|nr:glucuronate isomerase [Verrucomicrobiota bacterium]HNU50912.1 glucuronate isomerase [Verrucomicrobiota bacterium]
MNAPVSEFRRAALTAQVDRVVNSTPVLDIHTHLYDPLLGDLLLWGIDELLIYHYLVAEGFRHLDLPCENFWILSKQRQAEILWNTLFIEHSPLSEACRGVLTTLHRLGLDVKQRDLPALREWFRQWNAETYVTHCLELANVRAVYMTNSPFDDIERPIWQKGFLRDDRFIAALRVDPLLTDWTRAAQRLLAWGYDVGEGFSPATLSEVRRFLADWTQRLESRYLMISLPPDFSCEPDSDCTRLIQGAVLPHCRDFGQPFALMLGVRRAVNPDLRLAGDGVGHSNLDTIAHLCAAHPQNKFLVTVLARENQHELCVLARKFRNLHPFGCWWFLNIPHLIDELTRIRLELLGVSFTAQHSDARVLDQILYKWDHTRRALARVLVEKYSDLAATGWEPTAAEIERDVRDLLGGSFERFLKT